MYLYIRIYRCTHKKIYIYPYQHTHYNLWQYGSVQQCSSLHALTQKVTFAQKALNSRKQAKRTPDQGFQIKQTPENT